jgi:hypothetical protein
MRILFKTPHQLIFRRCFLVDRYEEKDGFLIVHHGAKDRMITKIPLAGTVIRFIGV